ncbi:MAG: hypothetical protein SGI86_11255 [Deltaproteobacteria bacterium]|nr:hypothetical protein [Deltaproteobacteria bacterium]
MINQMQVKKVTRIVPMLLGGASLALLFGLTTIACDDDSTTNPGTDSGLGGSGGVSGDAAVGGSGGAPLTGGTGVIVDGGEGGVVITPPTCKNEKIAVNADITTSTTWACNSYVMKKKIHITNGATLTIAAGSTIYGDGDASNPAALIATRDGKLIAKGTATSPIVFTSIVTAGQRAPGDALAGVVLLGKAAINNGTCAMDAVAGGACDAPGFFENVIEGIDPTDPKGKYGGTDDTHDCGELSYVRVEFAGFVIGAGNELNGITLGGCGNKTKVNHVQVHRGFDDGLEIFGGTVSVDHVVLSGSTDDGFDVDNGWRGKAQFVVIQQSFGIGDKGIEADNLGGAETTAPRTDAELWNFTIIGEGATSTRVAMHLREGFRSKLRNFIVTGYGSVLDEDAAQVNPNTEWPTFLSIENSVFFGNTALGKDETTDPTKNNDMGFDEIAQLQLADRKNSTTENPMITGANLIPPAGTLGGKATPVAPLDITATYAGAVAPGTAVGAAWWSGWTAFPMN